MSPSLRHPRLALLADIGATNARFGLIGPDGLQHVRILRCADYPTLVSAARDYLDQTAGGVQPVEAAIAIAGPVTGDRIAMTNLVWTFSVEEARAQLGLAHLAVINDFTAVALAVPLLAADERRQIGPGRPEPDAPIGVIGPGTGLGVSGLVRIDTRWQALAGEGGHVTMAPIDERESAVLGHLRRTLGHVSAERVLSGQGLVNLYQALAALDGRTVPARLPAEISRAALEGSDPVCVEALAMFCAMLGTVAGNLALTLGARGGVYIAGGIVPRLGSAFDRSAFRARFTDKGRMSDYLEPVPTYVITHQVPAFLGLKSLLDQVPV